MKIAVVSGNVTNMSMSLINNLVEDKHTVIIVSDTFDEVVSEHVWIDSSKVHVINECASLVTSWYYLAAKVAIVCKSLDLFPKVDLLVHITGEIEDDSIWTEEGIDSLNTQRNLLALFFAIENLTTYLENSEFARIINVYPNLGNTPTTLDAFSKMSMDVVTRNFEHELGNSNLYINGLSYDADNPSAEHFTRAINRIYKDYSNSGILFELDSDGWVLPSPDQHVEVQING